MEACAWLRWLNRFPPGSWRQPGLGHCSSAWPSRPGPQKPSTSSSTAPWTRRMRSSTVCAMPGAGSARSARPSRSRTSAAPATRSPSTSALGPYSIAVGAAGLPAITRAVTINGYSQAGSSANTLAVGSNAVLLIELNGAATGAGVNGLTIAAPATVRGLVINRFAGYGIQVSVGGARLGDRRQLRRHERRRQRRAREQPGRGGLRSRHRAVRGQCHHRRDGARRSKPGFRQQRGLLPRHRALQLERQHDPGELRRHERRRHLAPRQRRRGDRTRRRPPASAPTTT